MRRSSRLRSGVLVALVALCCSASAATIVLESGGVFRVGDVIEVGEKVEFTSRMGRVQIRKRNIVSIDGVSPAAYFARFSSRRDPPPGHSSQTTQGSWRLRAQGTVWGLQASINGKPIPAFQSRIGVEGGAPFAVQADIGPYVRAGDNQVDLTYQRTAGATLEMLIELVDSAGEVLRRSAVQIDSGDANAGDGTVRRAFRFPLAQEDLPEENPPVGLSDAARYSIRTLLQQYYEAHARKDLDAVLALQEEGSGRQLTKLLLPPLFASPSFRFEPFDPEGIELNREGSSVVATRSNGQPLFTSNRMEITLSEAEDGLAEGSIAPTRLSFRFADGRWLVRPGL